MNYQQTLDFPVASVRPVVSALAPCPTRKMDDLQAARGIATAIAIALPSWLIVGAVAYMCI